ncbi:MAG: pantetheine-phosphate adenylyltransferase [Clostridia bacterium]|nr:pantetheine-phosphate adenylyltransferase [Clostridia bacterium]MBR7092168.1 pantetheine-phosphate adenylyltransferase [Clostridia bacterium]
MRIALCPGSFDPVTLGHLDIIHRAAGMFDQVVVLVGTNASKKPLFTSRERVGLLRRTIRDLPNVTVDSYDGLLVDYARAHRATAIVKGLRAMSDFEYEFQMALTNRKLYPEVETVFLTSTAEYMYLSSSLVKQVASFGGDFSAFVPADIVEDIRKKIRKDDKK